MSKQDAQRKEFPRILGLTHWEEAGVSLSPATFARWERRCGPDNRFRIFYDVDVPAWTVRILARAVKDRKGLLIGDDEYRICGLPHWPTLALHR